MKAQSFTLPEAFFPDLKGLPEKNDELGLFGKCSTARIATAQKLGFQANLQIRSQIFDNFQIKKV
jgi:hypothetical protein